MDARLHENIAKLLYPAFSFRKIQRVNSILDNPSQKSKMFGEMTSLMIPNKKTGKVNYYNPMDVFGLGAKSYHRRTNHDPLTSAIMTTIEAGPDSVPLAHLHTMLDAISDNMKRKYGRAYRDLWQAQMNYTLEKMVRRQPRVPF